MLVAAPRSVRSLQELEPQAAVMTLGWGWQNDTLEGRMQPITRLKGLKMKTIDCRQLQLGIPSEVVDVTAVWPDGAPKFLCVPAKHTGSTCYEDFGGNYQLCHLLVGNPNSVGFPARTIVTHVAQAILSQLDLYNALHLKDPAQ